MPSDTVFAGGMGVIDKGSMGKSMCFPDVCLTPSGPTMVPMPYPNTAMASDLKGSSKTVFSGGNEIAKKSSYIDKSSGDEAGKGGGVVSHLTQGKACFVNGNMTVLTQGEATPTHGSMITHNHAAPQPPGNTAPNSWMSKMDPAMQNNDSAKDEESEKKKISVWVDLRLGLKAPPEGHAEKSKKQSPAARPKSSPNGDSTKWKLEIAPEVKTKAVLFSSDDDGGKYKKEVKLEPCSSDVKDLGNERVAVLFRDVPSDEKYSCRIEFETKDAKLGGCFIFYNKRLTERYHFEADKEAERNAEK